MTRVLIVAQIRLYREGLADVLARAGLEVGGVAASRAEAVETARVSTPDVAILHLSTPEGLATARELSASTTVVALAVEEVEEDVFAWVEAGVAAYVTPDTSLVELLEVIEAAGRGEFPCSAWSAGALLRRVQELARAEGAAVRPSPLTPREQEIVALIDAGCANKEIASRLQIELPTVKNHVHHILEKLAVNRRGEAAARMRALEETPRTSPTA